jgi:hypothetical protein
MRRKIFLRRSWISNSKRKCYQNSFFQTRSKSISSTCRITLSKTFKSIIARRINDLAKIHDLFSVNQMKKRKNRNCETILKLLTRQIHIVWNMNKNKITTLLSMNVVEAYNHMSCKRLLHNLWKRRISIWIIVWADNFMQNRRINLIVKAEQTIMSNVNVDISQNSLMSLILYLFYNAEFLKLLKQSFRKIAIIDFVDDINIFTYDINIIENCKLFEKMHEHCLLWNRRHEAAFASIKYKLIHFFKNIAKFNMQTSIKICDVIKQFSSHVRVWRVQIDSRLKWDAYLRSIQKKMTIQSLALSRLTAFTWDACFLRAKLIYSIVIRSIIIYDSII